MKVISDDHFGLFMEQVLYLRSAPRACKHYTMFQEKLSIQNNAVSLYIKMLSLRSTKLWAQSAE